MPSLYFSLHNKTTRTIGTCLIAVLVCLSLTNCVTKTETEPVVTAPQIEPSLSPLPLENLTKADYKFAQAALDQLGYRVVYIDGIWGPRSATAIRQFEHDNRLATANGRLSELNLTRLSEATSLTRTDIEVEAPKATSPEIIETTGIAAKLDPNVALSASPQLIITDLAYNILAKPNPYSETVIQLPRGAGLYIIGLQEGWYEVETLERQHGYIPE